MLPKALEGVRLKGVDFQSVITMKNSTPHKQVKDLGAAGVLWQQELQSLGALQERHVAPEAAIASSGGVEGAFRGSIKQLHGLGTLATAVAGSGS